MIPVTPIYVIAHFRTLVQAFQEKSDGVKIVLLAQNHFHSEMMRSFIYFPHES